MTGGARVRKKLTVTGWMNAFLCNCDNELIICHRKVSKLLGQNMNKAEFAVQSYAAGKGYHKYYA